MSTKQAVNLTCRITLFTRQNCSLCSTARNVLLNVQKRKPFLLNAFDVMEPVNQKWKIYEFDVPVIHVEMVDASKAREVESNPSAKKLMHRLNEEDVEQMMDLVQKMGQ